MPVCRANSAKGYALCLSIARASLFGMVGALHRREFADHVAFGLGDIHPQSPADSTMFYQSFATPTVKPMPRNAEFVSSKRSRKPVRNNVHRIQILRILWNRNYGLSSLNSENLELLGRGLLKAPVEQVAGEAKAPQTHQKPCSGFDVTRTP
jgi:hypothetical protein